MSRGTVHRREVNVATEVAARDMLIAEARAYLLAHSWPRLQTSLILAGAGGAAFLTSMATLAAGLDGMALRYGIAALAGYLAFLGLIGAWIAWYRHGLAADGLDVLVPDGGISGGESTAGDVLFAGGRSGSAGGGASLYPGPSQLVTGARAPVSPSSGSATEWSLGDLFGGDDAWPIVVCAVGVGYFAQRAVPEAKSIGRVLERLTTPER